ncbi:DNA mismatch repair protein MutS [Mesorhizobium sp. NBSH29]|uniref:Smr/MutS family protein n=1 Tax=Mesorhizobium sp. NBSH29 TaxID=2654249 RepID=UPI0018963F10|nr:Smr/MutS family protein [Mesorhizobium sp. NBSH29]QPC86081.1 DNA mismatch repair protein MutS [Mesorhizobium sp. NBSH29]
MTIAKKLTDEDRVLWGRIARSAKPLKGRVEEPDWTAETADHSALERLLAEKSQPTPMEAPKTIQPSKNTIHPFDPPTKTKLSKGRLPIEGRVDLHGMTQSEAHALLYAFLHRAYAEGRRHVLVITGKGASFGSEGVLRRAVPQWLATPAFRVMVSSYADAARHHGGFGAIYVRLRRH